MPRYGLVSSCSELALIARDLAIQLYVPLSRNLVKTALSKAFCPIEFCHLNLHGRYIITHSIHGLTVSATGQFQAVCVFQNKNEEKEK
jgi:hypothetical protein